VPLTTACQQTGQRRIDNQAENSTADKTFHASFELQRIPTLKRMLLFFTTTQASAAGMGFAAATLEGTRLLNLAPKPCVDVDHHLECSRQLSQRPEA
jgi:hypothetical protein